MPIEIHAVAVPALLRGLSALADVLQKAEAHARDHAITPSALLTARLFPDMFPLTGQVRSACDTAKRALARLTGAEPPQFENDGTTFEHLHERIRDASAYIAAYTTDSLQGSAERTIEMKMGTAA